MSRRRQRRRTAIGGDRTDPRGLSSWMHRYLEWVESRHYAADTLANFAHCLELFRGWAEERGVVRPDEVTRPVLERYQRWLYRYRKTDDKPLTVRTQHNRLSSLRGFFKWLVRENVLLHNPSSEVELPRLPQQLPKATLAVPEVEQVLNAIDLSDPLGIRDRAMLETLYSTGIRRSELIGLDLWDVDWNREWLMIRRGKGRKDRVVPIGERALAWIDRYVRDVRPQLVLRPDEPALFVTQEGGPWAPTALTHRVRHHVEASGVGKSGSCHLFRHSAATLMLERGADIRYIQEMLGHSKLETTQIYTRVSIKKLKAIHDATHPGARLERKRSGEGLADLEDLEAGADVGDVAGDVPGAAAGEEAVDGADLGDPVEAVDRPAGGSADAEDLAAAVDPADPTPN